MRRTYPSGNPPIAAMLDALATTTSIIRSFRALDRSSVHHRSELRPRRRRRRGRYELVAHPEIIRSGALGEGGGGVVVVHEHGDVRGDRRAASTLRPASPRGACRSTTVLVVTRAPTQRRRHPRIGSSSRPSFTRENAKRSGFGVRGAPPNPRGPKSTDQRARRRDPKFEWERAGGGGADSLVGVDPSKLQHR